jgi:hypothetical protein
MNRMTSLGLVGAALATLVAGCADFDVAVPEPGVASSEHAIGLPPCDPTDEENNPLLCGWQNGAQDWFNLFQKSSQTDWLNQPSAPPVLESWEKPWTNDWEGVGTNSYAIGWTRVWNAAWPSWSFNGSGFAWALNKFKTDKFVGNGCAHPTSQTGAALLNGCNEVVTAVCAAHPLCCGIRERIELGRELFRDPRPGRVGSWDATCVASAVSLSEPADGRYWAHSVLDVGTSLPKAPRWHDYVLQQGKIGSQLVGGGINLNGYWEPTNECAKKVCNSGYDSCCTAAWTDVCVEQAFNLCSARYTANTRIESENVPPPPPTADQPDAGTPPPAPTRPQIDRVFADVCYEATVPGFNACPIDRTTRNGGKECCRRALVLQGVYRAIDTTKGLPVTDPLYGLGRLLDWEPADSVRLNRSLVGPTYDVSVTMALDPCSSRSGTVTCLRRKHKMWQVAGPGGPLYPDYPESGTTSATLPYPLATNDCSQNIKAEFERCADWTHQTQGFRELLMAAVSALITTDASHEVDFRWRPGYVLHNGLWREYSEQTPAPFIDEHPAFQMDLSTFDTWEGNWGTKYEAGHLITSANCYGWNAPQRAHGDLVLNVPRCEPGDAVGLIQSLFNVPLVLQQ